MHRFPTSFFHKKRNIDQLGMDDELDLFDDWDPEPDDLTFLGLSSLFRS
jgi:hypothetical protein